MFYVLIVDDEPIIIDAYKKLFNWESHGFTLSGIAHNGQEALNYIEENDVDIVITDLKMPVLTGLDLIRRTNEIKPNIKFIVISGFNEFHLVNEAYKLGVKEYFLKIEFDKDTVLKSLSCVAKEIMQEREQVLLQSDQNDKIKNMESILHKGSQVLMEKQFKEMFWNTEALKLTENQQQQSIGISTDKLCVIVIDIEKYYKFESENWNDDRELLKFAILNILEETLNKLGKIAVFCNLPHEYICVFSHFDIDKDVETIDLPLKLYYEIETNIKTVLGLNIGFGVSQTMDGYKNFRKLYRQARLSCDYKFIIGNGCPVYYSEIYQYSELFDPLPQAQKLKELLKNWLEPEQILNNVHHFCVYGKSISPEYIEKIKELFRLYYYEICYYIKQIKLSKKDNLNKILSEFEENLMDYGNLPELNQWIKEVLVLLANETKGGSASIKAKQFIHENYYKNISLVDVAEYLGLSESYLSRIFKYENGVNFGAYLLQVRMQEATKLLKNTNFKVYEISSMVGYSNVEYFSRSFKSFFSISPKEYLKNLNK